MESYQSCVAASPPKLLSVPKDRRLYSTVLCRGVSSSPKPRVAHLHFTVLPSQLARCCQATCIQMDFPMLPPNLPSHNLWLSSKYDYLQCLQGIVKSLFWSAFQCIFSIKVICCSDIISSPPREKKKEDVKRTCKLYRIQWTFCFKWNIQISFEKDWFGCQSALSFPCSASSLHFSEDLVPFYRFPSLVYLHWSGTSVLFKREWF